MIAIVIVVFIFFSMIGGCDNSSWDSDDDGLSNDFEEEYGTDPDEYTWNYELHN